MYQQSSNQWTATSARLLEETRARTASLTDDSTTCQFLRGLDTRLRSFGRRIKSDANRISTTCSVVKPEQRPLADQLCARRHSGAPASNGVRSFAGERGSSFRWLSRRCMLSPMDGFFVDRRARKSVMFKQSKYI